MTTIAVDAMGSDHAPQVEVEGAVLAARDYGVAVQLVGQPALLERHLARHNADSLPISIVPAADVIAMDESPVKALRRKPGASVRLTALQVREGRAQGMVSAGNTGAAMATAKMELGTLPGVDRPALASVFPTKRGTPAVLVDVGANVDCRPQHLHQFAIMGEVYYRVMFGVARPRVGLLSIGEEATKGNEVVRETHKRLKETPLGFDFVGNVEGRDLVRHAADVVVCDAVLGNVTIKFFEGLSTFIFDLVEGEFRRPPFGPLAYLLMRGGIRRMRTVFDYEKLGGSPLLGVRGTVIITHGRARARMVSYALEVGAAAARARIPERIAETFGHSAGRAATAGEAAS